MDPLTFVAVALGAGILLSLLGGGVDVEDEDIDIDETPEKPGIEPKPKTPIFTPPKEDSPEPPILQPPDYSPEPAIPEDEMTPEQQGRLKVQQWLDSLGYKTDLTGNRTPLYVSAVDAFQFDVKRGENYYAGGQAGAKPVSLLQQYGSMSVDGWAGKQTSAWLKWAVNNKTAFSEVTFAATNSYPGFN